MKYSSLSFSVCLALYNGSNYIESQLNSILQLLTPQDEIIIVDDASSDCSISIVEKVLSQYPKLHHMLIKHSSNKGHSAAFQTALMSASKDIVLLSDQDDLWLPNKLSTIAGRFLSNPSLMTVIHDAYLCDENLSYFGIKKSDQLRSIGLDMNHMVAGCCLSFRRSLLDIVLPFYPSRSFRHDVWICMISRSIKSLEYINDPLIYHRRHSNNASKGFKGTSNPEIKQGTVPLQSTKRYFRPSYIQGLQQAHTIQSEYIYLLHRLISLGSLKDPNRSFILNQLILQILIQYRINVCLTLTLLITPTNFTRTARSFKQQLTCLSALFFVLIKRLCS